MLMPQGGRAASVPVADAELWQAACDESLDAAALEASGFVPGAELADVLLKLPQASAVRAMSARSRERLDRLMPQLFSAARADRRAGVEPAAPVPADAGGGAALVLSGPAGGAAGRATTPGPPVRRQRLPGRTGDRAAAAAGRRARSAHRPAAVQAHRHHRRNRPGARHAGGARGGGRAGAHQRVQGQPPRSGWAWRSTTAASMRWPRRDDWPRWPSRWSVRCWRWPNASWSPSTAACPARVPALPCSVTAASVARSWALLPIWTWCLSTTAAVRRR